MLVSFLVALVAAEPGRANYLLTLSLAPDEYTTSPGGQITLRGFFTTADALTFTYSDDRLFGLTATSPHLDILAGSVLLSQNFNPPVGGVYFADEFGGGGYLGPTVNGPAVTSVTDLRTFAVPLGTPFGTYRYSYGVDLFPTVGGSGSILYDVFTIHVTPEPSSWVLLMVAFGALGAVVRGGRRRNSAVRLRALDSERLHYEATEPGPGGNGPLLLTPMELLDRLAALVPPPHIHRHRYFGVLARTAAHWNFPRRPRTAGPGRLPPVSKGF